MARISFTIYKKSVLATIISFLSRITAVGGFLMAIAGVMDGEFSMLGGGALAAVIGIGGTALAEYINIQQSNVKWWKEAIVRQGLEAQISNSVDACVQVYNANPRQWTLNKIRELNPSAAARIQQALAAKK